MWKCEAVGPAGVLSPSPPPWLASPALLSAPTCPPEVAALPPAWVSPFHDGPIAAGTLGRSWPPRSPRPQAPPAPALSPVPRQAGRGSVSPLYLPQRTSHPPAAGIMEPVPERHASCLSPGGQITISANFTFRVQLSQPGIFQARELVLLSYTTFCFFLGFRIAPLVLSTITTHSLPPQRCRRVTRPTGVCLCI